MEPRPDAPDATTCPECRGTGFVVVRRDDGTAARRCRCREADERRVRLAAARIPARYEHCDLGTESFSPLHNAWLARAHEMAQRVVAEFRPGRPGEMRGLLFHGPCGVGKTHLAVGILRRIIENFRVWGLFTEFGDLLRRIQDTYDPRSEKPSWAVLGPALESDVLVLDDLGCTRMTPWVQDILGLIINERYNGDRLTILTTNRAFESVAGEESLSDRIGERLTSRLAEMCWIVRMDGQDFRRTHKSARHLL